MVCELYVNNAISKQKTGKILGESNSFNGNLKNLKIHGSSYF